MNRRQAQKDWFAIARTPTWLARLLMALALAAVFALLGQWQLGRALPAANPSASPKPNATAGAGVSGQSVFKVKVDQANIAIIGGRLQPGGKNGFWLVSNSKILRSANQSDVGKELTIAWGWAPTFEAAVAAHVKFQSAEPGQSARRIAGVLAAAEAPLPEHPAQPFLFDSLSLGQLVNFYQPFQARNTLEKYLIAQPSAGKGASKNPGAFAGLDPIVLTAAPSAPLENVNWLSAFYAIEWSVFAGFAVFMWWRLVEDERLRRKADAEAAAELQRLELERLEQERLELERIRLEAEAEAAAKAATKPKPKPKPKSKQKPRKPRKLD